MPLGTSSKVSGLPARVAVVLASRVRLDTLIQAVTLPVAGSILAIWSLSQTLAQTLP